MSRTKKNAVSPSPVPVLSLVVSPERRKPKKRRQAQSGSALEDAFYGQIVLCQLPLPVRQYRFAWTSHHRKFAFDFCYPQYLLAIEVEGGVWSGGRHTRGSGFIKDIEKYNLASLCGWKLYRVTAAMIEDGSAISLLEQALAQYAATG